MARNGELIRILTLREMELSYRQSALGALWLVFQPLALLIAFFVAFSGSHARGVNDVPYVVFALVGLCVWSYFQASVVNGAVSILKSEALVRRAPCPRIAFPTASVASRLPILGLVLLATIVLVTVHGLISLHAFLLPLGMAWLMCLTIGVVWLVSAFAVHYRDTLNAVPLIVQAGSFLAPIGYSASQLSPALRTLVDLDPITGLVEFWRWLLIGAAFPGPLPFTASIIGTGLAVILGWHIFSRCEVTMADVI